MVKGLEKKRVVIAVGGSGGHLMPAKALANDFLRESSQISLLFMGARLSRNAFFEASENFKVQDVASSTFFQKNLWKTFKAFFTLSKGVWQSLKYLRQFQPDCVVGFGSFHSLPVILAALLRRVPYSLFEPNTYPGKVNRFFSKWAEVTWIQFMPAKKHLKGAVDLIDIDLDGVVMSNDTEKIFHHFGLEGGRKTLLVFGGSQGAQVINERLKEIAPDLKENYQVIHFTGKDVGMAKVYKESGVPAYVADFSRDIEKAWTVADLVICRAGAGAIREVILHGKPAIMVPYPHAADNHQWFNGQFVEKEVQGGVCLSESLFTKEKLKALLDKGFDEEREAISSFREKNQEKTIYQALGEVL